MQIKINSLFKFQPVLLEVAQVNLPPGLGKGLSAILAFVRHLFFWSVEVLSVLD